MKQLMKTYQKTYKVYIDKIFWGTFKSEKSKELFKLEMQENLKHLHPLNMSDEAAIEYRKRYVNSVIYVYDIGEKELHLKENQ